MYYYYYYYYYYLLQIPQVGVREIDNNQKFYKHAVESVKIEEEAKDALNEIRYFDTASNRDFTMPNPNDVDWAEIKKYKYH